MVEALARFEAKVDRTPSCWLWRGGVQSSGYGVFWDGERSVLAHRFAWETENGPIPEGVVVLHSCDNPSCVRPDHLETGSQGDNLADAVAKGRAPQMTPRSGPGLCPKCARPKETKSGYCRSCQAEYMAEWWSRRKG